MGGRGEGRLCRLRGPQIPLGRVCREPLRTGRTADVAVPQLRTVPWFSWALQALLSSCQYFLTVSRGFAQTPATGAKNSARRGLRAAPGAITESTLITGEGSGRDSVLVLCACRRVYTRVRSRVHTREHMNTSMYESMCLCSVCAYVCV